MRCTGLDVHEDNIAACVLTRDGKAKFEKDFTKNGNFWKLDEPLEFGR